MLRAIAASPRASAGTAATGPEESRVAEMVNSAKLKALFPGIVMPWELA